MTQAEPRNRATTARRALVAAAVVVAALAVAVGAALATSEALAGVNLAVERASAWLSTATGDFGTLLPLGFAFTAGMVSAFNPCGFALLPAYLGLFLAEGNGGDGPRRRIRRLGRSLAVGGTVSAGFVVLFVVAGLAIVLGSRVLVGWLPWIGLGVGVLLLGVAGWLITGGSLYTSLPDRLGARLGAGRGGTAGYFIFGVTYGLASLSCTLPIFLAVLGTTLTGVDVWGSLGALLLYGLGMGAVIITLTLATGVFSSTVAHRMRRVMRHVGTATVVVLLVAGAYIVYYWLTVGGLLADIT